MKQKSGKLHMGSSPGWYFVITRGREVKTGTALRRYVGLVVDMPWSLSKDTRFSGGYAVVVIQRY